MIFQLFADSPDFKLTDLLSAAGATIGVIIAGTIFLQFLSTKYEQLSGRYRSLTGEYRGHEQGETRHGLLQAQIRAFRMRLWLMNHASRLAAVALVAFLLSVLAGGLSMVFPPVVGIKWVGTATLFLGLALVSVSVGLEWWEINLSKYEISEEAGDLDDPVKSEPFGAHRR